MSLSGSKNCAAVSHASTVCGCDDGKTQKSTPGRVVLSVRALMHACREEHYQRMTVVIAAVFSSS